MLIAWDEPVQADKNFNKRIAIQQRDARGDVKSQAFITPDSLLATFPVVANVKDHVSLVAYTVKKSGRFYIELQRITL